MTSHNNKELGMQVRFHGFGSCRLVQQPTPSKKKIENFRWLGRIISSRILSDEFRHVTDDTIVYYTGSGFTILDYFIYRFQKAMLKEAITSGYIDNLSREDARDFLRIWKKRN